jgi:hypothetical protein
VVAILIWTALIGNPTPQHFGRQYLVIPVYQPYLGYPATKIYGIPLVGGQIALV